MIRSRPVEIDGRFVGVAVLQSGAWRFIATEPAALAAQGPTYPDIPAMRRQVQRAMLESRLPPSRRAG